ncbi:MAG TPA: ski2-like helicase, partial [Thermoplasmata archaeon]|nr:ski2-like helicase [Thermoplasmata archaeon]
LRALVATPTLAAGINLPARRVVVRDTTRYDDRLGMQAPIPAMEVQQMCGRAGRPRFDSAGEAVLLARSVDEAERFLDQYLSVGPEEVQSRLAAEPALRTHVLALVASGEAATLPELEAFFAETFYGHTLPLPELTEKIGSVRSFLEEHEFLVPGPNLRATRFGALTSELYLDPMSALVLRRAVERAPLGVSAFPLLAAIAATPDMPPLFLRRGEESDVLARYADEEAELLFKAEEEPLSIDLDLFLATVKTAMVLEAWTDETPIVELTERFGIGAGDLRGKVEDAEWLLFGASRLAMQFNRRAARAIDDLSLRVLYGVREELLDLVRIRGVGRVRGRALFAAGFPDRDSLRNAPFDRVSRALRSPRLAEMILEEVKHPRARKGPARSPPPAPVTVPVPAPSPATRRSSTRPLEEYPDDPTRSTER